MAPVPGSNLLATALRVITPQTVAYHRYNGQVETDFGTNISQYAAAQDIRGSFQPVARSNYKDYGLDYNKTYAMFYVSKNVLDIERDVTGDQITYCGQRYQCQSVNPWFQVDGWDGVLCVKIGDENAR